MRSFTFKPKIYKRWFFLAVLFLIFPLKNAVSKQNFYVLNSSSVKILFEDGLESGATDVENLFPHVRNKIESLLEFHLEGQPKVVLIKTRQRFLQMVDNPITVAFAVPDKNLIVIDYSKIITHSFSLERTLMHEFCHLLLHRHILNIPRWLDEGISQWASGSIDEIIYGNNQTALNLAAITGKYLPFNSLNLKFPTGKNQRILAYQQSKNFVNFIVKKNGKKQFLQVLNQMQRGYEADAAFYDVFKTSIAELEKKWHQSMARHLTWITWLSGHLYELLFFCASLVCVFGFVKLVRRKQNYSDEDSDRIEE